MTEKTNDEILKATLAKVIADTAKVNLEASKLIKELKWYEIIVIAGLVSGFTLAIVAITKLFL